MAVPAKRDAPPSLWPTLVPLLEGAIRQEDCMSKHKWKTVEPLRDYPWGNSRGLAFPIPLRPPNASPGVHDGPPPPKSWYTPLSNRVRTARDVLRR